MAKTGNQTARVCPISDPTPTESLVGYDLDGVPSATPSRVHTDGEHHVGDTTVILKPDNEWSELDETLELIRAQGLNCTGCGVLLPRPGMCNKCVSIAREGMPLTKCMVQGCDNFTALGACRDCMDAIEQDALDSLAPHVPADQQIEPTEQYTGRCPFWLVMVIVAFVLLALFGGLALIRDGFRAVTG